MALVDSLVSYYKMEENATNPRTDSKGSNDLDENNNNVGYSDWWRRVYVGQPGRYSDVHLQWY